MKTLYHRIIFISCILLLASRSFATGYNGIGLVLINDSINSADCLRSDSAESGGGPGGPAGAGQGLTLTISAYVVNYDSIAYSGPIDFGFYDTNSDLVQPASALTATGIQGGQVNLSGYEKIAVTIHIAIPLQFRPGPDVVVVWPTTQRPTADSLAVNILLPGQAEDLSVVTSGITNTQSGQFSYIISQDKIELVNLSAGLNFKQVRIYSMNGQLLFNERSENITEIELPGLPYGIYNCELLTGDNSRKVIRFVQ